MSGLASIERVGRVAVIRFANPPHGYMTSDLARAILTLLQEAAADPASAAIVLTGAQAGVFVRHYDVLEIVQYAEHLQAAAGAAPSGDGGPFGALLSLCGSVAKPVIAAINGLCMGGGYELALACDIRIAGTAVRGIGLPETGAGIFPGAGGTQRLPRLIGEAQALKFILEGMVVDAAGALALGLVHELAEDPLARALAIGAALADKPAAGLAAAKRLVRSAGDQTLEQGLAAERAAFAQLIREDAEALARMRRFVQDVRDNPPEP